MVKRSFKNFDPDSFIEEVSLIDWSLVYRSKDLDLAVYNFTLLYLAVLNKHAPWVRLQQRKHYAPWISSKTKDLITERDKWKDIATKSANNTEDPSKAWAQFKKLRNKINNQKRTEELRYKEERVNSSLNCPQKLWQTTKNIMG